MQINLFKRKSYIIVRARFNDYAFLLHAKVFFNSCMCSYPYTTNVGSYLIISGVSLYRRRYLERAKRTETVRMRVYEIRWSNMQ